MKYISFGDDIDIDGDVFHFVSSSQTDSFPGEACTLVDGKLVAFQGLAISHNTRVTNASYHKIKLFHKAALLNSFRKVMLS